MVPGFSGVLSIPFGHFFLVPYLVILRAALARLRSPGSQAGFLGQCPDVGCADSRGVTRDAVIDVLDWALHEVGSPSCYFFRLHAWWWHVCFPTLGDAA